MILQTRRRGDPLAAVLAGVVFSSCMDLLNVLLETGGSKEDFAAELTLLLGLIVANHVGFELAKLVPDSPAELTHKFPSVLDPLRVIGFYVALQGYLRAMKVPTEPAIELGLSFAL